MYRLVIAGSTHFQHVFTASCPTPTVCLTHGCSKLRLLGPHATVDGMLAKRLIGNHSLKFKLVWRG